MPPGGLPRPPLGRLEHAGGLQAEERGQGAAGMPEDLHPEVGEPGAGLLHSGLAATPRQRSTREAHVAADAGQQPLEGRSGSAGGFGRLQAALELGDLIGDPALVA